MASPDHRCAGDALVSENAILALIGVAYVARGAHAAGVALILSSLASAAYHESHEQGLGKLRVDMALSVVALAATIPYLLRAPPCARAVVVGIAAVALVAWVKGVEAQRLSALDPGRAADYDRLHLLWHRLVSLGQLLVVATFR